MKALKWALGATLGVGVTVAIVAAIRARRPRPVPPTLLQKQDEQAVNRMDSEGGPPRREEPVENLGHNGVHVAEPMELSNVELREWLDVSPV